MVFFARTITLLAALTGFLANPAAAEESPGFFSRFIPSFGSSSPATPATAAKSAPAPSVSEPSGPTEANPFNSGSGGLFGKRNAGGTAACDGVLCVFMGGETTGRPAPPPSSAGSAAATPAATFASARRPVDDRVSPRKEGCTAPANDPWKCYR